MDRGSGRLHSPWDLKGSDTTEETWYTGNSDHPDITDISVPTS